MTSSTTAVTLKLQKFLVVDFLIMSMRPHKHNGSWQWKLGQEEKNKSHHIFFFWHSGKLNPMLNYMKRMHIWETKLDLIGCPTLLFFFSDVFCSREHWSKKTYWSQVFFFSFFGTHSSSSFLWRPRNNWKECLNPNDIDEKSLFYFYLPISSLVITFNFDLSMIWSIQTTKPYLRFISWKWVFLFSV